MKIKFLFAWYDLWVGIFIDREKRRIFVLPLPCVGFVIQLKPKPHPLDVPSDKTHIDDWISYGGMTGAPEPVIWWFHIQRLPSLLKYMGMRVGNCPKGVFATHEGKRVRVVMASRLGDVGITENLTADCGYTKRVFIDDLEQLSTKP